MSETRVCKRCGVEYPATDEFFTSGKGSRGNSKTYLKRTCRKCTNSDVNARYHRVVKQENAKKKEVNGPKERIYTCKLPPYSIELGCYLRTCPVCKRELPLTKEFFYPTIGGKIGLGGQCKECRGFQFTPILDIPDGYTRCSKCNIDIITNEENFYTRKDSPSGFSTICRSCHKKQDAQYRQDNLEIVRERGRQQDIKRKDYNREYAYQRYWSNREEVLGINKKSRTKHIEKRRAECRARSREKPEERKAYAAKYRLTEVGRMAHNKCRQKRRAIKRTLPHDFTAEQWISCKEHFNHKCAYCEQDTMMDHDLDQEHFVCVENGGGYTLKNIIPACRTCNSRKHTSNFFDWYPLQDSYTKEREEKILNYLGIFDMSGIQQLSIF